MIIQNKIVDFKLNYLNKLLFCGLFILKMKILRKLCLYLISVFILDTIICTKGKKLTEALAFVASRFRERHVALRSLSLLTTLVNLINCTLVLRNCFQLHFYHFPFYITILLLMTISTYQKQNQ